MPRPKNKKFKSLDDGFVVNILPEQVEQIDQEDTEQEIEPSDSVEIMGDEREDVCLEKIGEDQVSVSVIVPNSPPKRMWSDGLKLKFKTGDLIVQKGDKKKNILKVIGPGTKDQTYCVKNSGSDGMWNVPCDKVKRAPKGSNWISYIDAMAEKDPYTKWKREQELKNKKNKRK